MGENQLRQLYPVWSDAPDLERVYDVPRRPRHDRPHIAINMVASVDGATAAQGVSGGLSSATDKRIFFLLRSLVDVVLVGAATVRTEGYGTVARDETAAVRRAARGQSPAAALAIVSKTLQLDWSAPLFAAPSAKPLVICPVDANAESLHAARVTCTVVQAGRGAVDLAEAMRVLRTEHGVASVLCEGGPTLNGQLAGAGLLDELCLTTAPVLVGGGSMTLIGRDALPKPVALRLVSALADDSNLFVRYTRAPS